MFVDHSKENRHEVKAITQKDGAGAHEAAHVEKVRGAWQAAAKAIQIDLSASHVAATLRRHVTLSATTKYGDFRTEKTTDLLRDREIISIVSIIPLEGTCVE